MTNFERIKAMSVEEFAEAFGEGTICGLIDCCPHGNCKKCILEWLESEVQDEAD